MLNNVLLLIILVYCFGCTKISSIFASSNNDTKIQLKMKVETRINVRGSIKALRIGDFIEIPRTPAYPPSYVRNAASLVAMDSGRKYSVSAKEDVIIVTRLK